jgi:hypothetical protein
MIFVHHNIIWSVKSKDEKGEEKRGE